MRSGSFSWAMASEAAMPPAAASRVRRLMRVSVGMCMLVSFRWTIENELRVLALHGHVALEAFHGQAGEFAFLDDRPLGQHVVVGSDTAHQPIVLLDQQQA